MDATFQSLLHGFSVALQFDNLWYAFLGCVVGTLVGVLPGIGPLSGISILLPVTYGLNATQAVIMLAGIYYGSQYGGSTTSILMRIPGEAASVMTCIDGYAMAQRGRAGAALCIAAMGSFIAGTFGVIMLTLLAPPLAVFALGFGPPEYAALLLLGLVFLAYMSPSSLVRTLLMASFGLLLGTNADAVQYFPLVKGRAAQGLVCVNHEYFSAELVFPGHRGIGMKPEDRKAWMDKHPNAVAFMQAAHGVSVQQVRREAGGWKRDLDSRYSRRITARTAMDIDYDTYADGEALLGWLNATCQVRSTSPFDGNRLLSELAAAVQSRLAAAGVAIAHF